MRCTNLSFDLLVDPPESENVSLKSTPFYGDYDLVWTNNRGYKDPVTGDSLHGRDWADFMS